MKTTIQQLAVATGCMLVAFSASDRATGQDELREPASWKVIGADEAKTMVEQAIGDDAPMKQKVADIWADLAGDNLNRAAESAALLDPAVRDLLKHCEAAESAGRPITYSSWDKLPEPIRDSLRLYYTRWLVRERLFDEASQQLAAIKLENVVDPAAMLFYQSVVSHRLLDKKACVDASNKLLENAGDIPRRYEQMARLLAADIQPLKTDSPDEIARMMSDVERRLDLGRAGKRVRKQEDEIVAKLDKLIKKLEEQLQQQQQQQPQGGQSSRPLDDSKAAGMQAAGDVQSKDHDNRAEWGNLPPERRRTTLQQISRELGAHYREVIEEYFRKIARDSQ